MKIGKIGRAGLLGLGMMAAGEGDVKAQPPLNHDKVVFTNIEKVTTADVNREIDIATERLVLLFGKNEKDPKRLASLRKMILEQINIIVRDPLIKNSTERVAAVRYLVREFENKKRAKEINKTAPVEVEKAVDFKKEISLNKTYDDGVTVNLVYSFKIANGQDQILVQGNIRGFSPINYFRGKSWEGLSNNTDIDEGIAREAASGDMRHIYMDWRVLQSLDPKTEEYRILKSQHKNNMEMFRSFYPGLEVELPK